MAARAVAATPEVSRWLFLRLLGAIFLIAFLSLWVQINGLLGHDGILPVDQLLQAARERLGPERYWDLPTLCWLNPSDACLHALCATGVLLSVLLVCDVAPALVLFGLWAAYLSFVTVGREFLSFQWDNLLLETGFLAIFLAPLRVRPRGSGAGEAPPHPLATWLLRLLLFKVMFSSGVVKLSSGDPTWRHLAALQSHYETQPLPTWLGWYAHQLPAWMQHVSCGIMFGIELVGPFLIFGPRLMRRVACAGLIAFQLLIAATGNYCFFNLLTIALCLLLLDDAAWPRWMQTRLASGTGAGVSSRRWPWWILGPLAAPVLLLTSVELVSIWRQPIRWPAPVLRVSQFAQPLRTVNSYGLFAVMTTTRPEIILEGSRDGTTWLPYEFTYKPGDLSRRPEFVAPHQPRLDWQMWFAALSRYQDEPWFLLFCQRVLQGSKPVLALLSKNPFPDGPPRYLRAIVYEYHFTDLATQRARGTWWRRSRKGLYCPMLTLAPDGLLSRAMQSPRDIILQ